jgi:hypothetical protein
LRSGLPSQDFPFDGSKTFYERHNSPGRTFSLANPKAYQTDSERPFYQQITGQESHRNNPFMSNINYQYSQHIQHTQKPQDLPVKQPLGSFSHMKQNELIIGRLR